MHLSARIVRLELEEPFTIARGTETEVEVVQVEIAHDGTVGMGEATPIERYDEYASSALAYLEAHADELGDDPFALDAILERIPREQFAARSAIDSALHDLCGKLARLAGVAPPRPAAGGPADVLDDHPERPGRDGGRRRASERRTLPPPQAEARRAATAWTSSAFGRCARPRIFRYQVDVNEYWSLDEALEALPAAGRGGRPVLRAAPRRRRSGWTGAEEARLPFPIYVDEDCHTLGDVAGCAERAHGINIKLAKSGGIREAVRMARAARRSAWE